MSRARTSAQRHERRCAHGGIARDHEWPPVHALEHFAPHDVVRRPGCRHAPPVEQHQLIGKSRHQIQLVAHQQDGHAIAGQAARAVRTLPFHARCRGTSWVRRGPTPHRPARGRARCVRAATRRPTACPPCGRAASRCRPAPRRGRSPRGRRRPCPATLPDAESARVPGSPAPASGTPIPRAGSPRPPAARLRRARTRPGRRRRSSRAPTPAAAGPAVPARAYSCRCRWARRSQSCGRASP